MDEQKTGTVNGAKGSARENDSEAKVNKTLLLRQQIEENRMRMQQREKEISNSKKNLEQLFTQLDRSCSGVSLNLSTDVEDVRDTKIASLESSLSALKSEKRELDLRLLSLETVQEAKECLELEMSELRASHDHLSAENHMLQARLQNFHALEDENDELKLTLDRLAYENSGLKEDLEAKDGTISSFEVKLSRLNRDLEEISARNASMVPFTCIDELQQQINQLANERDNLKSDCEALQAKLNEGFASTLTETSSEVKVSSLGAKKKPRGGRRSKGDNQPASDETKSEDSAFVALESQIALLTAQRDTLEGENVTLKTGITNLESQLAEADSERHTLQQRVELLMAELSADANVYNNNDFANLQMLLQEREAEYATLSAEIGSLQAEKEEMNQRLEKTDGELFQLRSKCRDFEYNLNTKEETIRELQLRLTTQPSETPAVKEADVPAPVKVSSLGAAKKSRSRGGKGGRAANESKTPTVDETPSAAVSESLIATLNTKIATLKQEISTLHQQTAHLADLESQKFTLEEQLAVSEQEKRTLQKRVDLLLSELETTENNGEVDSLQGVLQLKEEECTRLTAKVADIQAEKNEVCQRLDEADGELFKLRTQQRDTQYMLSSKDESISELHHQLETSRREVDQLKELMADLERKLTENESSKEEEEKSISSTVVHLQEALRQARHELSNLETELTSRSEAVQRLEKSCSSLTKDTTEKTAEIQRLKEDLQDAEVVLAEKDAKLKTVQDELNRMKISADENNSIVALETELSDSQVERELIRNDLETRCSQLNECKLFSVKLESELEEARAREAELLGFNEIANAQKTAAEEKLSQLSEKYKKLAANYKQKLQVIQQLESKVDKLKKATESEGGEPQLLQMRLVESESEITSLREQLGKLKEIADLLTQSRQTLSQTEEELRTAKGEAQKIEEERKKLLEQLSEYQDMTNQLEQVRHTLLQTEEELKNAKEETEQVGEERKKLFDQLNEYQHMTSQLEQARLALGQTETHLHSVQADANQLAEENRSLQQQIASCYEQLQSSTLESQRVKEEYQTLLKQMNDLRDTTSQSNQYQEAVQLAENELQTIRGHLQQAAEENRKLADHLAEVADARNHLDQMKQTLGWTENELATCQTQLQCAREESQQLSYESRKMMEQLDRSADRIYQLEQLNNEFEFKARESESVVDRLQHELKATRDQLQSISASLEDQGSIKSSLEDRVQVAESETSGLRLQLVEVSNVKDNLLIEAEGLRRRIEELQGEVNSAVESSTTLHNQLADLWEEKQNSLNHNAHLIEELNRLKCQQEEQSTTKSVVLEREIQELREQLAAAQWDLDTKTNELSSTQELRDQLSAVQWDLDAKVGELSSIQQQRDADAERIAQLEKQCSDTSSWIKTNLEDASVLQSRIQELENQLADLNNQYGGLYSSYGSKLFEMTALENQVADANLKITEMSEELARKQSTIDEQNAMNSTMEQEARSAAALREQLIDLEKANADLLDQVSHLRYLSGEVENIRSQMQVVTEERDELLRTIDSTRSANEEKLQLTELVADLRRQVDDSVRVASEEKAELIYQKQEEIADLQREIDEFRSAAEGASSERSRLLEEIRCRESESLELRQQLAGLQDQIKELQKSASDVQEIGLLRMNLADLSAERDDLNYQIEDIQAQCSDLETKVSEAEEVRSILETTVSYLESKVSELQAEVAAAATAREEDQTSSASQLAALTEERDAVAARLLNAQSENQELNSLRLTLDEAERMLKESDSTLNEARQAHAEALVRTEEVERQLADSLRCLSEEQHKHRLVLDERAELTDQVAQANQVRSELLEQVAQLQNELSRVEAVAAMCNQYQAKAEEYAKLRSQIDEWKHQAGEVSQLRLKLFEAISEKDDLESSVQALEEELATVQNDLAVVRMQLEAKGDSSSELATVQEELASVRKELDEANRLSSGHLLAAQEQLAAMRIELEASHQSSAELNNVRKELESNIGLASTELDVLRSELEAGRVSTFELNARCADLDMERNLLMEKCMEMTDIQRALESKCVDLEQLKAEAVAENERLQSEHSKLAGSSSQLSESNLTELAQLRVAIMDLTSEKEELDEKLAEAEEKLIELTYLRITNSELSMELEEAQARIQVIEEERDAELTEMKRQLSETVIKLSQQEERIDRVSVERDQLQQTVSKLGESSMRVEKAEMETQEKTEGGNDANLLKQIAGLESELHEAKIKAAKSLRQVKLLRSELTKEKEAAAAAASAKQSGGDDYFNFAVEEELRKQLTEAEKVTAEKVKEIERLLMRIDTLEGANERFMQAKERQDNEMAMVQQRNRELLSQMASMEWDNSETSGKERAPDEAESASKPIVETSSEQIAALESTISQLTDDNENYQDLLDELKAERQAAEAELKERISTLEADINEKSRLLDEISQQMENKDRLLSDAYESVSQLRKQVMQLSECSGEGAVESAGMLEELRRENENLVDMIRQLSTTGTLDAATVQRLKDEMDQVALDDGDRFQQSSDTSDSAIDWHRGFNELQIEVEYLRSQNVSLLNRLQEAGLVWDEGADCVSEDNDRIELLRLQLDNAIRNVHERDMRCQELTWEITKLLEERDTLQLRLSNSLRQNHEMQQELKDFSATASGASPIGDITAKLRELKQLNYSLDVQLRREQEERQTIERQLMALYGTRGGSTSPIYANGARRSGRQLTQNDGEGSEFDLSSSHEISGTGQVLSEWLKGKESTDVQHV